MLGYSRKNEIESEKKLGEKVRRKKVHIRTVF